MEKETKILILSEDNSILSQLSDNIHLENFNFLSLARADKTVGIFKKNHPQIVLIDLYTSKVADEIDLLQELKLIDPQSEIIFIGEEALSPAGIEAISSGAYDYIKKPLDFPELAETVTNIHRKRLARQEIGELEDKLIKKYQFQGMIAQGPQMLNVFSFIRRIAKHPTTVLITGETGTGKELVAKAIHNLSQKKNNRFVSCNCAALAESLLESELFGHVKGAFTGAIQTKHGLFEYGNNGTIFLDEIGDISQLTQTKLLRVLESREIQRVGSNENIQINIRLVSATNKELEEEVLQNRFRKDLFYRLNVAHICLPPLRERKEDIPLLCNAFIRKFNEIYEKKIRGISQPAKLALLKHNWPGNIRELEHVIERGMSLCLKDFLTIDDIPPNILDSNSQRTAGGVQDLLDKDITLEELEKKYILRILRKAGGNKVQASKLLGLSRRSLYRKLEKYNLS